jgi:molecular chaperone GrpE
MAEENQSNQEEKLLEQPTPNKLEEKLAECEARRDEYLAGWQRAKADFINYKKEELARLEEVAKYANEALISELISVMDSFDLGIASLERQGPVEKGIYMIRVQIQDLLKKHGLERIIVKQGDPFNPSFHEIIGEAESGQAPNAVVEEIEAGYTLYGKVLRPARVKVSRGKAQSANGGS